MPAPRAARHLAGAPRGRGRQAAAAEAGLGGSVGPRPEAADRWTWLILRPGRLLDAIAVPAGLRYYSLLASRTVWRWNSTS